MHFHILTIFPAMFDSYFKESILARAQKEGKVAIKIYDVRKYTTDKHRKVDDTPYGGGAGMVMKVEPIYNTIKKEGLDDLPNRKIILLSARGKIFDQKKAEVYQKLDHLILIAGRYEGVDQRVADRLCDEELSVGPYVLSGGELPAMTVVDSVSRLIPGVLGNEESLKEESYGIARQAARPTKFLGAEQGREYPQYTKPEVFQGWAVPEILKSGDHQKIADWRSKMAKLS